MIISASRRTDIPAFYSEWFMNRIRAGYCLVTNPFKQSQVTRVSLEPEDVDAIVFSTRNPAPLIPHLPELDSRGFRYYFLYTITGYPKVLEPRVPPQEQAVRTFRELSKMIGPERVIWRYDPILITSISGFDYHPRCFEELAAQLEGATMAAKVSLADSYRAARMRLGRLARAGITYDLHPERSSEFPAMMVALVESAARHGIRVESCAEEVDLRPYGIQPGKCIDDGLIERVFGVSVPPAKDSGQRKTCKCAVSKDIGAYDTCPHGCLYCYATGFGHGKTAQHDPHSETLAG